MGGDSLAGRVAVVSGAGKGLGREFAIALARAGAAVVVNNRNRTVDPDGRGPADHVVEEITTAGGRAVADYSDVRSPGAGRAIVERALCEWGRLDVCVANAGINRPAMFHRQSEEDFEEVISVNLIGASCLTRAAMAVMRRAGYGRIVMVASTGGLHGLIGESAYAASKGALIALGRTMAAEGLARGVLTNIVLPYALTQMTEQGGKSPEYRAMMSAASVAPVVVALADPGCRLNGESIIVGGGRLRRASAVEWGMVEMDDGVDDPRLLAELVERSRAGGPSEFRHALDAFEELMGSRR